MTLEGNTSISIPFMALCGDENDDDYIILVMIL